MRATLFIATLFIASLLALWLRMPALLENNAMSASAATPSQEADVASALAGYDATHRPEMLRRAADAAARADGNPPANPAAAPAEARTRIKMWTDILSRTRRDLDPNFDPTQPPSQAIELPVVHGRRLLPLQNPSSLTDPEERAALEKAIAERNARVARFETMATLAAVHDAVLEKAANSLRDVRDVLGLSVTDIEAALGAAPIARADRAALQAAIAR